MTQKKMILYEYVMFILREVWYGSDKGYQPRNLSLFRKRGWQLQNDGMEVVKIYGSERIGKTRLVHIMNFPGLRIKSI